jgi:hypothetical protein
MIKSAARRGHNAGWPLATSFLTTIVLPAAAFAPALRPPAALSRSLRLQVCTLHSVFSLRPAGSSRDRLSKCMATVAPGAGQDLGELFDLYEAPQPSVSEFRGEPKKKGVNKARKKVHADGDWHR